MQAFSELTGGGLRNSNVEPGQEFHRLHYGVN